MFLLLDETTEGDLNMHSSKGFIIIMVSEESHPVPVCSQMWSPFCTLSVSILAKGNPTATSQNVKHKGGGGVRNKKQLVEGPRYNRQLIQSRS